MTPKESKGGTITVVIDPDKKAAFQDLCEQQGRPMNRVIVRLIEGYVDGDLKPKDWN